MHCRIQRWLLQALASEASTGGDAIGEGMGATSSGSIFTPMGDSKHVPS